MSHSLPQLELLASAANRLRARRAALELQTVQAAVACRNVKNPGSLYKKLAAALEKESEKY